jgi:rhodanese-related sulfurtransferase
MQKALLLFTLMLLPLSLMAKTGDNIKIFSKKDKTKAYQVGEGDDAITITRKRTKCAPINGWIQALIPAPGIHPITELEVLQSMKQSDSILIDMRSEKHYLKGTIPTAVHIPYNEISFRLDEVGCEKQGKDWNCSSAKKVYGFCNGPACPQSGIAMKRMIENGFPADKIYYYRGGMMNWKNLGFTIVEGE